MKNLVPQKVKTLFYKVLKSNSSPQEVADGLAIGMFVAMLPIMGIQMYVSLILTRLFRKNSLVAILAVWVTNPFTAVPIYLFNLWVGNYFYKESVSWEHLSQIVRHLDLENIMAAGKDILIPLLIGSAVVGVVVAYVSHKLCFVFYERVRTRYLNR